MFKISCNLARAERNHRMIIGSLLVIAGLLGFGRIFLIITGLIIAIEGLIGWCGLPGLIHRFSKSK